MEIWIAVVGSYADARTLGTSYSKEGANLLIARAKELEEFDGYLSYEWNVTGPFKIGEIYGYANEPL